MVLKCYIGKGHSAPLLEDLMRIKRHLQQDEESVISDIFLIVQGKALQNAQSNSDEPPIMFTNKLIENSNLLDHAEAWLTQEANNFPNLLSDRLLAFANYVNPF